MRRHIHTSVRTYISTYINTCVGTYMHTYLHTYMRRHIHTYIHTYMRRHIHTYIHTYIHFYYVRVSMHTTIHIYILLAKIQINNIMRYGTKRTVENVTRFPSPTGHSRARKPKYFVPAEQRNIHIIVLPVCELDFRNLTASSAVNGKVGGSCP